MNFNGIIIGLGTFLIIGILHPVIIKAEYYIGKCIWPAFMISGAACVILSVFIRMLIPSVLLAVLGFSLFWGIRELFEQEERVRKGWYPDNPNKENIPMRILMKKLLLSLCGGILLIIATIGIFLPLLPTTPLVLLAALCFSISSEKLYKFILKSRLFGPYIENYRSHQGVPMSAKIRGIIMLWLMLILSAIAMKKLWSTIMFSIIGIGVTIHLSMLKTKKTEKPISNPSAQIDK